MCVLKKYATVFGRGCPPMAASAEGPIFANRPTGGKASANTVDFGAADLELEMHYAAL